MFFFKEKKVRRRRKNRIFVGRIALSLSPERARSRASLPSSDRPAEDEAEKNSQREKESARFSPRARGFVFRGRRPPGWKTLLRFFRSRRGKSATRIEKQSTFSPPPFPTPIQPLDHALMLTGAARRVKEPADIKKRSNSPRASQPRGRPSCFLLARRRR